MEQLYQSRHCHCAIYLVLMLLGRVLVFEFEGSIEVFVASGVIGNFDEVVGLACGSLATALYDYLGAEDAVGIQSFFEHFHQTVVGQTNLIHHTRNINL